MFVLDALRSKMGYVLTHLSPNNTHAMHKPPIRVSEWLQMDEWEGMSSLTYTREIPWLTLVYVVYVERRHVKSGKDEQKRCLTPHHVAGTPYRYTHNTNTAPQRPVQVHYPLYIYNIIHIFILLYYVIGWGLGAVTGCGDDLLPLCLCFRFVVCLYIL